MSKQYIGKLARAELYNKHDWPYTNVKAVYEANKGRYPGKLIVCNAHWFDPGPKPIGNYKVAGQVISKEYNSAIGFGWSGNERPVMGWSDMTGADNFVSTIPAIVSGVRQDVSNQTSGVKRSTLRTWWGFDKDGNCTVEVTTSNYTLDGIIDRMESLGIVDGLVLDGSGSSQSYDGETHQKGDGRTVYSFLLLWFDNPGPQGEEGNPMKIYLSPSSQFANLYAGQNTNEQVQCNRIAEALQAALRRQSFTFFDVKKAPEGQTFQNNVKESNAWGADLHIPIHTNAGGGHGPVVFVYGLSEPRMKYAQPIYAALNAIVPRRSNYGVRKNPGLYEVGNTTGTCIYAECAFHDNPDEARWIIDNVELIGEALCRGICEGAGLLYKPPTPDPIPTPDTAYTKLIKAGYGDILQALADKI